MALKDVAPVLAKDFVTLMIDQDRMVGGNDMLKRYCAKPGGIPWFVFLDGDGTALITSDDPDTGNIGYPGGDVEAPHFKQMLEKVARQITPAEIEMLLKSAQAFTNAKIPE
jgi:hypothetical protein